MKKLLLVMGIVLASVVSAHAERLQVVERDTVIWDREVRTEIVKKENQFGETRIIRKAVLMVKDAENYVTRKVTISRATFDALNAGAQAWVVICVYEDGSERITKVITK